MIKKIVCLLLLLSNNLFGTKVCCCSLLCKTAEWLCDKFITIKTKPEHITIEHACFPESKMRIQGKKSAISHCYDLYLYKQEIIPSIITPIMSPIGKQTIIVTQDDILALYKDEKISIPRRTSSGIIFIKLRLQKDYNGDYCVIISKDQQSFF